MRQVLLRTCRCTMCSSCAAAVMAMSRSVRACLPGPLGTDRVAIPGDGNHACLGRISTFEVIVNKILCLLWLNILCALIFFVNGF